VRGLLEQAGLTPEDVHEAEAISGVFQRRITALLFEEEKAPLALVTGVKRDEELFIQSTLKDLQVPARAGGDLDGWIKKTKILVRFFGRDLKKWSFLKKELGQSRWESGALIQFLVEDSDLFLGNDERFYTLLNFLKYFDHITAGVATFKKFARYFRVMAAHGMLDHFLKTCLENKGDRVYGVWAFQFAKLAELFKGDVDFFEELVGMKLSLLWSSMDADYKKIYQEDKEKFRAVLKVLGDLGTDKSSMDGHHLLRLASNVAKEANVDEFREAVELARDLDKKNFSHSFSYPSSYVIEEPFKGDLPKFRAFCAFVTTLQLTELPDEFARMTQDTLEKMTSFVGKKQHYPSVVLIGIGMFSEFEGKGLNDETMDAIFDTTALLFEEDVGAFKTICGRLKGISALYKGNIVKYKSVVGMVKGMSDDNFENLCRVKEVYGSDMEKFKIAILFVKLSSVVEEKVLLIFMEKFQREGEAAARAYLNEQVERSKALLGPSTPDDLRKTSEYMFCVKRVFPKGNYSDHDKNLSCGDQLKHVEGYRYDRAGYPVEMTGLMGYKLRDGMKEDEAKLTKYQERLGKVRRFVASRGPDNNALQEAFAQQVDGMFVEKAHPGFADLGGLSAKEKMLALFLTEVIKKAEDETYKPDPEIMDLIVEYKYAFQEDLEAYVRRTADEAERYKDVPSQHFTLWRELTTVYGENVKHVLRNDLFVELSKEGKNKAVLEARFAAAIPGGEDLKLRANQKVALEQTFDNPKIPQEKKPGVLLGQCKRIFGTNLKFSGEEAKALFEAELQAAVEDWTQAGQADKAYFFETTVPGLLSLRQKYVFDVNARLENLLTHDINQINQEVAKFEEVLEVEAKETTIGGPRSKEVEKSAKKRKIRSYFTKTKETANARMGAYLCIAGEKGMWENPNYFEMVMKDEESGKCIGLTMLLRIDAQDGKKYLWFGPNPFESFLAQVSSEQCYRYQYEMATKFAQENGFDGVVVPAKEAQILGACTNRGGDFPDLVKASRLRDEGGNVKVVQFGKEHKLGGSYGYSEGALIWEKKAV
jgi:hypothetical protein